MMIIAEAGVNHDGHWEKALDLVDIAVAARADFIKFQIFDADTCKGPYRDILKPLQLSYKHFEAIKAHCDELGIGFMASCFDPSAVDFVSSIGCRYVKIGSGEITNRELLRRAGNSQMHVILSTGMSTGEDVCVAVDYLYHHRFTLLHCTSNYPTQSEHCNLNVIPMLRTMFNCSVGFSDHTLGRRAALVALGLGATVFEKHFTYSTTAQGPDHAMSLGPDDIREYVSCLREAETMLGTGEKVLQPGEAEMQKVARGRW